MSETLGPPGSIPCPLCRNGIVSFIRLPSSPEIKPTLALSFCNPCISHPRALDPSSATCRSEFCKHREMASELICPLTCTPFPSVAIPTCNCVDDPCPSLEPQDGSTQAQSPRPSQSSVSEGDKFDDQRLERTSCSGIFWSRRSCHREQQCNSEINA